MLPAKQGAATRTGVWPGVMGSARWSAAGWLAWTNVRRGESSGRAGREPGEPSGLLVKQSRTHAPAARCCLRQPAPTFRAESLQQSWISQSPELVPVVHWGPVCAGTCGDGCSAVSARAAPGCYFSSHSVLVLVSQTAALSQQEEGSPAYASHLGLKGSDDKNAQNESSS